MIVQLGTKLGASTCEQMLYCVNFPTVLLMLSSHSLGVFAPICIALSFGHLTQKKSLNNLRVAYNNSFRILMGYARDCSASAMFVSNTIPTFEALRRKAMYNFNERLNNIDYHMNWPRSPPV